MNLFRRSRIAVVGLATAVMAVAALATLPTIASAQERRLDLKPDGTIDQPLTFLPANGIHFTLPAASFTAVATGTTNVFTVPYGQTPNATFVGGLPVPGTAATLKFYVTSVCFEYVTLTGASAAATVNVGSTGTTSTSIVSGGSLPYSGVAAGSLVTTTVVNTGALKPIASGDVITVNVGTAFASASVASLKVHVSGYYQ